MNSLKLSLAATLACVGMTWATPVTGTSLQTILDNIAVDGDNDINVNTDQLSMDAYWRLTASGGSVATMIIEVAGFANSNEFGIFDSGNPSNKVTLFGGSHVAGDQVTVSIKLNGNVTVNGAVQGVFSGPNFGYFLKSPDGTFYSDNVLNAGGADKMVAFQGINEEVQLPGYYPGAWTNNEYILAWEDLANGDNDFDDMVVMVESVQPIPEPATLGLMGLGLLGLGLMARRKSKA